tara:strand:- start:1870 stop:2640 length:771 start_codon:yes stop_codon:yes gene_type:complete
MERIDIWFGDSWTIGSELQSNLTSAEVRTLNKTGFPNFRNNTQNPLISYPALISEQRGTTYQNYAIAGGSYEFAYFQMCNWLVNGNFNNENEYTFWLQTTAATREFGIDYNFKRHHFQGIRQFSRGKLLSFQQAKSSPEFADFDANMMLNAIWTLCKANYIKLKIVPLWTGMNLVPEVNIVPNEKWIAEPNSNMLQKIFEKNVFPDGGKDTATMENEEIVEQIQKYDYITPNDCHPNKSGHYAIAKYIINILDKKI